MNYRALAGVAFVAAAFAVSPVAAQTKVSGADIVKAIDGDTDGTVDLPEAIAAATKTYTAINPDGDKTLEPGETEGRISKADWKKANKDGDKTLEIDEYVSIVRARFKKADPDHDGTIDAKEFDTPAGQALAALLMK